MRNRRRTTAVALAGGVALTSAGFAIGSQIDDGSAGAAKGSSSRTAAEGRPAHFDGRHGGPGGRGGPMFSSLADELGVSEAKLREALEDLRPTGDPGAELAAALAEELGVSQAKLRAALAATRPDGPRLRRGRGGPPGPGHHRGGGPGGPRGEIAADLAKALGVETAAVEKALEDFHAAKRDAFAQRLADRLGIDVDKVKDALPPKP